MTARDYARAVTLFTNVLQGDRLEAPVLAQVYFERGMAQHELGSLTQAVSDYTNAIWLGALAPSFEARVFLARGIAELEGNQVSRAETDFESAISKNANLADAYFGRATVRRLQGAPEAAIADYDKAIALKHPAPELVYFGRGLTNNVLGETIAAGRDFTLAVKAEPGFMPARAKLVEMGLPVPPQDGAGLAAAPRSVDPMLPISVATTPGLEVALGIAGDDSEATASLTSNSSGAHTAAEGEDAMMAVIAETGTSHEVTADPTTAGRDDFLRPPSDGLLDGQADVVAAKPEPEQPEEIDVASAAPAPAPVTSGAATPLASESRTAAAVPEPAASAPAIVADAAPATASPPGAPAAKVPAPEPVPSKKATVTAATSTGTFFVQIASYQQKELAEKGRLNFGEQFPEIAAQVPPSIVEAELADRGTVYRLRLGPLDSAADSANLCATLKRGGQDCIVVPPARTAG